MDVRFPPAALRRVRTPGIGAVVAVTTALLVAAPVLAEPSPEELRRQRERAAQLDRASEQHAQDITASEAELDRLSTRASDALEAYRRSREQNLRAQDRAADARRQLSLSRAQVQDSDRALTEYIGGLYRSTGGGSSRLATVAGTLDSGSPTEFSRGLANVRWVGEQQHVLLRRQKQAEAAQAEATRTANRSAARARAATRAQWQTKQRADAVVAEQREVLDRQRQLLTDSRGEAAEAERKAAAMAKAREVAEQRRREAARERREARERGEAVLPPSGGCEGGNVEGYSNGQLPTSALCEPWGAPGHLLRNDAANAFSALSRAYAEDFGSPICMTDSYRSYQMQVELYQEKPDLAAEPGTSNHGWARAVDLCDGIESFGTTEHEWMRGHAPAYGWYHPSWARQGSDREEPWHWEYGG